jgi:hypothetical protein
MSWTQPSRVTKLAGALIIITTVIIAASAMASGEIGRTGSGAYSCCGDSTCSVLVATQACPQGNSQCTGGKICCTSACNDPHSDTDPSSDTIGN